MTRELPRQLQARIERNYRTTLVNFGFSKGLNIPFLRIEDPDVVLDEVADRADAFEKAGGKRKEGEELHLPYWAELWDSAIGLGKWLSDVGPDAIAGRPLLDLGCGMGLVGTVAAAVGFRVTFADIETPALLFARYNSLPWAEQIDEVRRLNWRADRLGRRFDWIVGADILYEREQWNFLEPFWRAHLAPAGRVLLGEPGRQTGDLFGDWIVARGWRLVRHEVKVQTRERPIRLFEITPAKSSPD